MENNSNKQTEFDHSGQYDSGLKSLVHALRMVFVALLVLIIGMLIYFFSFGGYFAVQPQEAVIVLRFGKYQQTYTSDWHWFFPYPVTEFIRVRTNPQHLRVDFLPSSNPMQGEDGGRALEPGLDGYVITGDANIIHTSWELAYRVSDPKLYYDTMLTPANPLDNDELFTDQAGYRGRRGPQTMLANFLRQAVVKVTAANPVDDLLRTKKAQYTEAVQRELAQLVLHAKVGIEVITLTQNEVSPPKKTKAAFDEVASAQSTKEAMSDQAKAYRVKSEQESRAESNAILAAADTYRKEVVSSVMAESKYFSSINAAYQESRQTVLMSLYNNVLAEVLENQDNKYIIGSSTEAERKQIRIKINPEPPRQAQSAGTEGQ